MKSLAEAGITCVVSGGKVGDMMMHFANKYGIMVVRLMSKWDLRRLCKSICATALPTLTVPTAEETGFCSCIQLEELGDTVVVVFSQGKYLPLVLCKTWYISYLTNQRASLYFHFPK